MEIFLLVMILAVGVMILRALKGSAKDGPPPHRDDVAAEQSAQIEARLRAADARAAELSAQMDARARTTDPGRGPSDWS